MLISCTERGSLAWARARKPRKNDSGAGFDESVAFGPSLHVIRAATLGSSTHSPGEAHGEQALSSCIMPECLSLVLGSQMTISCIALLENGNIYSR